MRRVSDPASLFQAVSDPTRLRLLRLLGREELNVQELVRITGYSQPRVSKHLAVLRDQQWLRQRREGTWSWYRTSGAEEFPAGADLFRQVLATADSVAEAEQDDHLLSLVLADRRLKSRDFFAGIADRWDEIRSEFEHPDLRVGAMASLVQADLQVLDIGTGTGAMLPVFSGAGARVTALDNSLSMLIRARSRCRSEGLTGVEFSAGDVTRLPFGDEVFDACNCSMVLHHVASPAAALREMARVVKMGGKVMVTAFGSHDQTWMREELAHQWLGFAQEEIEGLYESAGLRLQRYLVRGGEGSASEAAVQAVPGGSGLKWPDVFLASGSRIR